MTITDAIRALLGAIGLSRQERVSILATLIGEEAIQAVEENTSLERILDLKTSPNPKPRLVPAAAPTTNGPTNPADHLLVMQAIDYLHHKGVRVSRDQLYQLSAKGYMRRFGKLTYFTLLKSDLDWLADHLNSALRGKVKPRFAPPRMIKRSR